MSCPILPDMASREHICHVIGLVFLHFAFLILAALGGFMAFVVCAEIKDLIKVLFFRKPPTPSDLE